MSDTTLPLEGIRILDITEGVSATTSRVLADLGADVIRLEAAGSTTTTSQPTIHGTSIFDAVHHANKRSIALPDDEQGLNQFRSLVRSAAMLVRDTPPGRQRFSADELLEINPRLVVVDISAFGADGPYRDWAATEWVLQALGGVLSASGKPGAPPLLAPGSLVSESAAVNAAYVAIVAYYNSLETGVGDHLDVSLLECAMQAVDPGFGIAGSATGGVPVSDGPRGRPDVAFRYPIFECADGFVRICVLAARQWRGLRAWLGEPEEFASAEYDNLMIRYDARDRLYPLIGQLFADKTRAELEVSGQEYGVPIQGLLTPREVIDNEHFHARGAFTDVTLENGERAVIANGMVEIDGIRAGVRRHAPTPGEHTEQVAEELSAGVSSPGSDAPVSAGRRRPLEGIRVLDLGVIVVGAEVGRMLADQGAEVIKVENQKFPDGSRASSGGAMTATFAWGHRNKEGIGLDLRDPRGRALFMELVAKSDMVLSNFKPGTMESLGLSHDELVAVNPDIITVESSALGSTGPWSRRMGYGPLVRAGSGLTSLWQYPEARGDFGDAATVYPDHAASRIGVVAAVAALVGRKRGVRRGAHVTISQAETILSNLSDVFALESISVGSGEAWARSGVEDAPRGLYPCAGEDEWCAITVRGDDDFRRLVTAIGKPELAADPRYAVAAERFALREVLDAVLTDWTSRRGPHAVMAELQSAGVPAGVMLRNAEQPEDPQLKARGFFTQLNQPQLDEVLTAEGRAAKSRHMEDPPMRPAPEQGQHTRQVLKRLLDLSDDEIGELVAEGVLESTEPVALAAATSQ